MANKDFATVGYNSKILTEDGMNNCAQELRKLVLGDYKLRRFRSDDAYLLRFLHCADFNIPVAFKRMQDFCNLLLEHPKWFASTSPSEKRKQIEKNYKVMLKERDRSGRRIFLFKMENFYANDSSAQEQAEIDEIWFESVLDEPETQSTGISYIFDMNGYSWRLFRWLTPTNMKIGAAKFDLYPIKSPLFHIVNTSFMLNASIKLVWPFMSNRLKDMTKFHFDNWSSLHEYVSPEVLPREYGGTGPEIDYHTLNKWLFDQDDEIGKRLRYQKIAQKNC